MYKPIFYEGLLAPPLEGPCKKYDTPKNGNFIPPPPNRVTNGSLVWDNEKITFMTIQTIQTAAYNVKHIKFTPGLMNIP